MTYYRIVETDNFGGGYPDEKFVMGRLREGDARAIAATINNRLCNRNDSDRYWKVVKDGYKLRPGFEA